MPSKMSGGSAASRVLPLVALVVAYVASGLAGLHIASLGHAITLFWPPTGIAIAGVVLLGGRAAPAIAVASLIVSWVATKSFSFGISTAVGNTAEALVAGALFARWTDGRSTLGTPTHAGAFAVASAIGCVVSAAVGTAAALVFVSPPGVDTSLAFRTWWFGDMVGAMLVAPACLSLSQPAPRSVARAPTWWSAPAVVMLAVATAALNCIHFATPSYGVPLAIAQLVAIVAATFRFGSRGAHVTALVISVVAVAGTLSGRGPYASQTAGPEYVVLWTALALAAGAALFVASIVTERATAERRLFRSEERLRALFEHAPNGMLLLDSKRRVVLANPTALSMAERIQFDDGDALRLLGGDDSDDLKNALRDGVARGKSIIESRMKHTAADGVKHEFVVRTAILGAPRGFDGAVVLVEDVTEREAARRERERLDQQLASAQRLDSVGKLAGGIAHDFNNMLQAIQANAELADLAAERGKDARPTIARVLTAAERASALTRQLLAFSRRQPASYGRVDVLKSLRSALALLERLLPEDIHLVFDPRATDLVIRGDEAQLEQVVLNLVLNARDAMPQGGTLRIELEAVTTPEGDERVRIAVTDEGPGVDAAIIDRVFEPFFTTKPTGQGTGLGLAVVYGIAQSHGGQATVENLSPRGARFSVELPRLEGQAPDISAEIEIGAPEGAGQKILLVEDDAMVRTAVRDMLTASGYRVSIASNGSDAVASYVDSGGSYDVVILDVVMPLMGGREAYERLREFDPHVRVLFATGYSEEQIDVGFVLRERVPVLTKPYDRGSLLRAIAEVRRSVAS